MKKLSLILVFIMLLSVGGAYLLESWLFKREKELGRWCIWAFVALCIWAVLFVIFTFYTPQIPLFQDPLTRGYGLS